MISERFKMIRKELGMSQAEMACKLGVIQTAVSKIENNEREISSNESATLNSLFEINLNWLYTGCGDMFVDHRTEVFKTDCINPGIRICSDEKARDIMLYLIDNPDDKDAIHEILITKKRLKAQLKDFMK